MRELSQQETIITALRAFPSVTSRDMVEWGIFKYSSRIAELRKKGYVIKARRVRRSLWEYSLEKDIPALNIKPTLASAVRIQPEPIRLLDVEPIKKRRQMI